MKYRSILAVSMLVGIPVYAADTLCAVAPQQCKILAEDEDVRVFEFTSKKGDKIPQHTHPRYIAYDLAGGGKTRWTLADGSTRESVPAKKGEVAILKPETHSHETLADEHSIITEIKR